MELFSVVLWHLKDAVSLSFLAHALLDVDRYGASLLVYVALMVGYLQRRGVSWATVSL